MDDAPAREDTTAEKDAEGAEEVDEGTQKIVGKDLCGFAALMMMPLEQTVRYTTHRPCHWREKFRRAATNQQPT